MTKDEQISAMVEQVVDTNKRLMVLVENLASEVGKLANKPSATAEEPQYQPVQYEPPARGTWPLEPDEPTPNGRPMVVETEIPRPEMPEYHPPVIDGANGGPGEGPG